MKTSERKKTPVRIGPRRYVALVVVGVFVVATAIVTFRRIDIFAATYTWVQSSWAGGATANTAAHPGDQTGWTQYAAKDATIAADGTGVALIAQPQNAVDTSDANFSAGTTTNTRVTGSGDGGSVTLATAPVWPPSVSTYNYPNGNPSTDAVCEDAGFPTCRTNLAIDTGTNSVWATITHGGVNPEIIKIPNDGSTPTLVNLSNSTSYYGGSVVYDSITPAVWFFFGGDTYIEVVRLNPTTGASEGNWLLKNGASPNNWLWGSAAWFDPVRHRIWGLNGAKGLAYLNLTGGSPSYGACYGSNYDNVIIDTAANFAYTSSHDCPYDCNFSLSKINLSTCTLSASGGTAQMKLMTYDSATNSIWMTDPSNMIYKYRASDLAPVSISVPGGTYRGLTYDGDQQLVWTLRSNGDNTHSLLKINPSTGVVDGTYAVPNSSNYTVNFATYDAQSGSIAMHQRGNIASPFVVRFNTIGFSSSGTFASRVLDTSGSTAWNNGSWTVSTPTNTTLTMRARTSNSATMVGAPDFSTCTNIASGNDLSTNNCVTDGQRYLQYEATLGTSDSTKTPVLNDATFGYNAYTNGTLTSSAYDAADTSNVMGNLQWSRSGTGTIQFQLRAASTLGGLTGATWIGPDGTNGTFFTNPTGTAMPSVLQSNARYFQYKAYLTATDQAQTPTLTGVTTSYVVNAPPEFQAAPTASQGSDGLVSIAYAMRDPDTNTGVTPGQAVPSFEYSNNGSSWFSITAGLSSGATITKTVEQVNYRSYSLTWDPTAEPSVDGTYDADFYVRVRGDDSEGANRYGYSPASLAFALDAKSPTLGSPAIAINATTTPATISLSATDDTALTMCVTLDNTETNCGPYATSTTLALATDPDTVYVLFKDARGNTASVNAVTPQTPTNLIIRDLSNVPTDEYQLFLTWAATSVPVGQFSQYIVYHSTDGATYNQLTTINDKAINYHFHKGLVAGSIHYYRIATATTAGNVSYLSAAVNATANGQGGGNDVVAPSISNVTISSISTQSVEVTWDTDELSDSTVGYSSTPGVFTTERGVPTMLDTATGVGQHRVTLAGLTPNTTYYAKVMSADPSGNEGVAVSGGDGFTFTTLAGPTISNVTAADVHNTGARITWQTNIPADSSVTTSTQADLAGSTTVTENASVTTHSVTLTGLAVGTRYYYRVASGVATDTNGGSFYSFSTTADSTAPTITNVSVNPLTDTQAVILWSTDERATSQVSYGTASGTYPIVTELDSTLGLTHSVTLNGLTPATTYVFVVSSQDASGNSLTSAESTFTTKETLIPASEVQRLVDEAKNAATDTTAPRQSNIVIEQITPTSARARWTTDEDANSFVQFGPPGQDQLVFGHWVYDDMHDLPLMNLSANTSYQYRVISADRRGNTTLSAYDTFSTTALPTTVLESQLQAQLEEIEQAAATLPDPIINGEPRVELTPTTATISWTTDKPANSFVALSTAAEFAVDGRYAQTVGDPDRYVTSHKVSVKNLSPETTYHYQVRSKTAVSQLVTTDDYRFQTPKKLFDIENYSADAADATSAVFRWTTNDLATATIKVTPYRNNVLTVDEQKTVVDNQKSLIHQLTVRDLDPTTQYHIELISVGPNNVRAAKTITTFSIGSTNQPPVISAIRVDSALSPGEKVKVQTIVSWTTNVPSTSQVFYRQGVGKADEPLTSSTTLDASYTKRHVVVLTTLDPGAVYQLRVESKDSNGLTASSKPVTTLTPQQERTVFQVITSTFQQVFGWTQLFGE